MDPQGGETARSEPRPIRDAPAMATVLWTCRPARARVRAASLQAARPQLVFGRRRHAAGNALKNFRVGSPRSCVGAFAVQAHGRTRQDRLVGAAAHLAHDKELKRGRAFFLAPRAAESLGYGLGERKMLFNTTDVVWQWVLSLAVIIASLLRLLVYIRRRRSQRFQTWEPAELAVVRMLVVLITGRPVTVVMWKRINTLLLT